MRTRSVAVIVSSLFITLVAGMTSALVMGYLKQVGGAEPLCASLDCAVVVKTHPNEVAGLWTRWPDAKSDGDMVRFYFFHPDGIGLYRYGKIGLNTTNSFDWRVEGDVLVLKFRKTGVEARTRFALEKPDGKHRALMLADDPKEAHAQRYTFVPPSQQAALAPDLLGDEVDTANKPGKVPGRLWMDLRKFATGGSEFSLYQLKDAAIDGRGVGWQHIGDFDDWSTEALTFRYSPSSCKADAELELWFTVRGEHAKTLARRTGAESGDLTLFEDPRSFWHLRTYKDAGPSFGSFMLEGLTR